MKFYLGLDLGTKLGVARLYTDGRLQAWSVKLKPAMPERCLGVAAVLREHNSPDCIGVVIEEPFSGQFSSVKALFPMMGAAVLACEQEKLPYALVNLATLKMHATGRGNAKKPEMQAAALARWGQNLGEDESDAAWAAAYGLDTNLFM